MFLSLVRRHWEIFQLELSAAAAESIGADTPAYGLARISHQE
jgi:hypothetical protein